MFFDQEALQKTKHTAHRKTVLKGEVFLQRYGFGLFHTSGPVGTMSPTRLQLRVEKIRSACASGRDFGQLWWFGWSFFFELEAFATYKNSKK